MGAADQTLSRPLRPGERVPAELEVVDSGGERISLASFRGEATLLIFLRHLG